MNSTDISKEGQSGVRPGREALPGTGQPAGTVKFEQRRSNGKRNRKRQGQGAQPVPSAEPRDYYGLPVINKPVWEAREIAGYFFLGGLAGACSVLAPLAQLTGRPSLARVAKLGAAGGITLSLVALVKDLGRPARFLNMLRVFKVTSPMSVGTWAVSAYAPAALAAAASEVTGLLPGIGLAATTGASALGPVISSYTGVLISDTAVPAWHEARSYMPFLFVSSAAMSAAGLGLVAAKSSETWPLQRLALVAVAAEVAIQERMVKAVPPEVAKAYQQGKGHTLLQVSKALAVGGALGLLLARRKELVGKASGLALLGASAFTRFGIFHAGMASALDPQATIAPQKRRQLETNTPQR